MLPAAAQSDKASALTPADCMEELGLSTLTDKSWRIVYVGPWGCPCEQALHVNCVLTVRAFCVRAMMISEQAVRSLARA